MKLKDYLTDSGVKQKFFAAKIGMSENSITSYVLGKKIPTISAAWRIHKATGGAVSFIDWLEEEGDIESDTSVNQDSKKKNQKKTSKNPVIL